MSTLHTNRRQEKEYRDRRTKTTIPYFLEKYRNEFVKEENNKRQQLKENYHV